ncbi:MAG: hypothetical protein ACE5GX_11865 [Thermoanaerobaculia bacterium]
MKRALTLASLVAAILFLLPEAAEAQCPMCRSALSSAEGIVLAAAFRRGILLLLGVPFAAVGVIAGLIVREQRRGPDAAMTTPSTDC